MDKKRRAALKDRMDYLTGKMHGIEEASGLFAVLRDRKDLWTKEYAETLAEIDGIDSELYGVRANAFLAGVR